MPKYLFESRYTSEGAKALAREGGTARCAAIEKVAAGLGGKVECMYFAFGDNDVYTIVDVPDNISAGAISMAVNQSGAATTKTVVLLTAQEVDQISKTPVDYRAPGR